MKVKLARSRNDPEKAVLPAIIWASVGGDGLTAHVLAFGWWDFHMTIVWSRPTPAHRSKGE